MEERFPYLKPGAKSAIFYPSYNLVKITDAKWRAWTDYKLTGEKRLREFMHEYPLDRHSYWGISNHLGEIETFWVPFILTHAIEREFGTRTAFRHKYNIIAKETLFGEKEAKRIPKESFSNQKLSFLGRFLYGCGAVKFYRYHYLREQLDVIIDDIVDQNKNLVIFPQGHRMKDAKDVSAGPVLGYLGYYSSAPVAVVPVHLEGDFSLLDWNFYMPKRKKLHFSIREPFLLDRESLKKDVDSRTGLEGIVDKETMFKRHRNALRESSTDIFRRIISQDVGHIS